MGTLFGPEWITQGLLAIGASGAFLALVAFPGAAAVVLRANDCLRG